MKLADNFYYKEFFVSERFPDLADKCYDREGNNVVFQLRFKKLCQEVLQPARDWLNKPIKIESGYRDKFLNPAVGGVPTSEHMLALAVDLAGDFDKKEMYEWLKENTCYRQLYFNPAKNILHVSVNDVDMVPFQHRAWIKE
jgi:zinc D-Ala-D-Ala carboxypeptidase